MRLFRYVLASLKLPLLTKRPQLAPDRIHVSVKEVYSIPHTFVVLDYTNKADIHDVAFYFTRMYDRVIVNDMFNL